MRLLLTVLMLICIFPVHAGKLVIEPGKISYLYPSFSFHSDEMTFHYQKGDISYGRLDLSPSSYLIREPHVSRDDLGLEAKDSVKRGVRGMVWNTDFLDVALGLGKYPEIDMNLTVENLSLLFDFRHVDGKEKNLIRPWKKSLEMDVFTLGLKTGSDYGFSLLSLLSLSPDAETDIYTSLSFNNPNLEFKIGRGNTLISTRNTENSLYLKALLPLGEIWISTLKGDPSIRPVRYSESRQELGYSFNVGSWKLGHSLRTDFTAKGRWRRNSVYFIDMKFARFTFVDGRMRFTMEPVYGLSIGVGARSTSISFRYKGIEIRRNSRGEWTFKVSVEMS